MSTTSTRLFGLPTWAWHRTFAACLVLLPLLAATLLAVSDVLGWIAIILSLLLYYATFIEPRWLLVTEKKLLLPGIPGMRIVVAGDFHVGHQKGAGFVAQVVDRINALRPDLILLVGDFLGYEDADHRALVPLKNLRATHGSFAVVGNHDANQNGGASREQHNGIDRVPDVTAMLDAANIRLFRNDASTITAAGKKIAIAGTDDHWMQSFDLQKTLAACEPGLPIILLSHNPDVVLDLDTRKAALIVCGHTHAGQIRLPFLGPIFGVPAKTNRTYARGIFQLEPRTTLAVTHGLGEIHLPMRFLARPEILVLNIAGDDAEEILDSEEGE